MSDFDPKKFRKEVEVRLKQLDNPKLSAAFAARMALLALAFLAVPPKNLEQVKSTLRKQEQEFLWYWRKKDREKHLLANCRAPQAVFLFCLETKDAANVAANAANVAATGAFSAAAEAVAAANVTNVANVAAADTFAAAAFAANTAAFANASNVAVAANAAFAANSASLAATNASNVALAAVAAAMSAATNLIFFVQQELNVLQAVPDLSMYLVQKISPLPDFLPIKEIFLANLRKLPEFDYWADWLQDRYDGNPLDLELLRKSVLLPEEIQAQSPREINRYLKQLRDGVLQQKMKRVRTIFIGNGEAGKTSLVQALNGEAVSEGGTDMTPGIDISEWPVAGSDLTAHFWDFGGQVIAHATHQFFLRARCVYVLVLNARSVDSNPNQQAEYWLEFVRAFGADAPVLLVGNKCDLTPVHVDMHRLRENYPNITGFFPLSATGYRDSHAREFGIFQDALCEQLRRVGETQPYFSTTQFELLETLRAQSRQNPFLQKSRFDSLCQDKEIEEGSRDSLLDLLDKLGEIIHFPDLRWLDEYLLNPRWLTYGVYQLLYSQRLHQQHGRLSQDDVAAILQDHGDNQGNVLCYPANKQYFLLEAMAQFKLCYPAPEARGKAWIVPDLLPSDQPPDLDFHVRDALRFDFDFKSFLPRHVLSMFITEHYRDISNHLVWQHGVRLHSGTWQSDALVRANYQDRVLTLAVAGPHADGYFAVLYHSVLKILERMPKLKYAKLLYLDEKARLKGQHFGDSQDACANFDTLLAMRAEGERKYICEYGTYDLPALLKLMPLTPDGQRVEVLNRLQGLVPAEFDKVVFTYGVPPAYLSGSQAQQAIELVRYAESREDLAGLERLLDF